MSQIHADVTMDTKLKSTDNNEIPDTSHEGHTGMTADSELINYSSHVELVKNKHKHKM